MVVDCGQRMCCDTLLVKTVTLAKSYSIIARYTRRRDDTSIVENIIVDCRKQVMRLTYFAISLGEEHRREKGS